MIALALISNSASEGASEMRLFSSRNLAYLKKSFSHFASEVANV